MIGDTAPVLAMDRARPSVSQVEALKWTGVVLMVIEHFHFYVLGTMPALVFLLGRLVFPLFVLAFAIALARSPWSKVRGVILRLACWACVAQAAYLIVSPEPRLNVLFSFLMASASVYAIACAGSFWRIALTLVPVLILGPFTEFGLWGVAFAFSVLWLARADWSSYPGWALVVLTFCGLAVPNGTQFALLAAPVAALILLFRFEVPRVPHLFYWLYAGQFVAYAVLQKVLA